MESSNPIRGAVANIIKDYDSIPDYEKKKVLIKNIKKPLYDAAGSWAFLFQYIPDELSGPEDRLSAEEIAIIRAAQLYFYHRHVAREEVHIDSSEDYFKSIDRALRDRPEDMDYVIKRIEYLEVNHGIDNINDFIYFIDLLKGDFKADYLRLAMDLLKTEIDGIN